ncbi:AT-hook motif nuclear-localized protein 10-like [Solanum stenotomum]|uniref:AT-hook motif nuclear-localized protein 10-like n=1 Tax=Solanum stenotomum TaxID=172797 RepID=UPI0020D0E9BB|nr:AT-hook motif nuclear-localized protein 10-like [Solanum stenotomum]
MNLSQEGPMKICILSATGGICNVTLQESATGGGIATYEGQFFIISLSGSVMLSESSRTCDLNVMLSRTDHIVFGGNVAGKLTAATPVVVSSFIPEKGKPESKGDDDAPKGIRLVDPPTTL